MAEIARVAPAFIFPPAANGRFHITDAAGAPVRSAATTVRHRLIVPHFQPHAARAGAQRMPGRYLFCGVGFGHFGHFVLESLSRLWAYDQVKDEIDGLIFFAKNPKPPDLTPYKSYFDAAGITHPLHFVSAPVQVDQLFVPAQGMGMGPFASGLPEQRAWLDTTFRKLATPMEPVENAFISRARYKLRRGMLLDERASATTPGEAGYNALHPRTMTRGERMGT